MKKNLLSLFVALLVVGGFACTAAYAENISDAASYQVDIPEAVFATLGADATMTTINSSDFKLGANDQARNTIVVGDGTGTSNAYVQTNTPTLTATRVITITAAGTNSDTVSFVDSGGKLLLRCDDNATTTSIDLIFRKPAGADTEKPTFGVTATPATFTRTSASVITAGVLGAAHFDAANSNIAPIGLTIDLDEGSLSFSQDTKSTVTFDLTLTVAGVNE